jgi:diacylglycerol kinase family enzyme
MRRRFFLIDNATAGYGPRLLAPRVVGCLERAGATVTRGRSRTKEDAYGLAFEAARSGGYDAILAAGGDGTIRQAARALADTGMPLGVIPVGTANVLSHEIGLPHGPQDLADVLLRAPAVTIRAPTVNGELFLLMAGAGFDGRVIDALSHPIKSRIGKLAYAAPVLGALARAPDALDLEIDGRPHRATWAVIANARHYGGAFVIAEGARLHDPGLSAVLFDAAERRALLACLIALASGRLSTCRYVRVVPCRQVEIRSRAVVPVQVDGDAFGSTPVTVASDGPRVSLIMPLPASAGRG